MKNHPAAFSKTSIAILLALLEILFMKPVVLAQGQPDAESILRKVSETYRNLQQYQFAGKRMKNWYESGNPHQDDSYFQVARAGSNKGKIQIGLGMSKFLAICDGTSTMIYAADRDQFTIKQSTDMQATIKETMMENEASALNEVPLFIKQYESISVRAKNPKLVGEDKYLLDKQPVDCWVIKANIIQEGANSTAAPWFSTIWVDKARTIILKEELSNIDPNTKAPGIMLVSLGFTITTLKINENLPDSLFSFSPPENTKKVEFIRAKPLTEMDRLRGVGRNPLRAAVASRVTGDSRDFILRDINGRDYDTKQLRGKIVILDFWATWCVPCRKQMKDLTKLHEEYSNKGVIILGISDEDYDTVSEFWKKGKHPYPSLLDTRRTVFNAYNIEAIPTLVFIDQQGSIRAIQTGARGYDELVQALNTILTKGK